MNRSAMSYGYISDDNFIASTTAVYGILQSIMSGDEHAGNEL